jgi:uncharacterized protein YhdP
LKRLEALSSAFNSEQATNKHSLIDNTDIKLSIDIDQLDWGNTTLGSVSLALARKEAQWSGTVDGTISTGTISYLPNVDSTTDDVKSNAKISLTLDHLTLLNTQKLNTENLHSAEDESTLKHSKSYAPQHLPDLEIAIQKLSWGDIDLGQVTLATTMIDNGLAINQLSINSTDHQVTTHGRWITDDGITQTSLTGQLTSQNVAHLLQQFGIYDDIRKTAADINFTLGWQSSPFQVDWKSLNGELALDFEHGRLLGVEPGVGRALGLFSLSAWQRRLRLDFSDVVDEGFAYDQVSANFGIHHGNAYSSDLSINGVAARVYFTGRIGLSSNDIDAVVTVIPRSSIALPLVGAALIVPTGPIGIGAGLVMQQMVGPQFETLTSSEYTITGQWDDPMVTTVPENGGIFTRMFWKLQKLTSIENKPIQ